MLACSLSHWTNQIWWWLACIECCLSAKNYHLPNALLLWQCHKHSTNAKFRISLFMYFLVHTRQIHYVTFKTFSRKQRMENGERRRKNRCNSQSAWIVCVIRLPKLYGKVNLLSFWKCAAWNNSHWLIQNRFLIHFVYSHLFSACLLFTTIYYYYEARAHTDDLYVITSMNFGQNTNCWKFPLNFDFLSKNSRHFLLSLIFQEMP